ncbi:MAG: hypothetical protein Ta2A_21000 [Treponemataceae bacterium]|nr:MAG: hypothetical protein Ta2A_21000 [Treponemataceae bacterium]
MSTPVAHGRAARTGMEFLLAKTRCDTDVAFRVFRGLYSSRLPDFFCFTALAKHRVFMLIYKSECERKIQRHCFCQTL